MNAHIPPRSPRVLRALLVLPLALITATCATNPVTGRRELSLVSESQEIELGKEGAAEAVRTMGLVGNAAVSSYVTSLGMGIAKASERPNLPWSFTVVDDPTVNAFALPGGPVFVTRGILTYMTSEAELVSVLGHEIGHITAKHSVNQISRAQVAQLGLGVGMIVSPELQKFGDVASQGLGVLFLKFSRDHETQADELGFKYMLKAGYDPHEMGKMFQTLDRLSGTSGRGTPEWLSTHPDPGNRVQMTADRIAAAAPLPANLKVDRDRFLHTIDGLVFGDNPRNGYFEGTTFYHPDLKFRFDFPAGWTTQNQADEVIGVSPQQDAVLTLGADSGTPSQALVRFLGQQGMQGQASSNASMNGLTASSASFTAQTDQGNLSGWVTYVALDGATYRILGYTPSAKFGSYSGALRSSATTFRRLTDATALGVQPARVHVVSLSRAMTLMQFNQASPSTIPLAQLAVINGVDSTATLPAGTLVKQVVKGS